MGVAHGTGKPDSTKFQLYPNVPFLTCLQKSTYQQPRVDVTVDRGKLNDTMTLHLHNFKPNLAFDLFTVENTPQAANGTPNPAFSNGNFGLAWYQSDIETNKHGDAEVRVRTILLDQIFGFDKGINLPPTNTFHVGFWFNSPADATGCGFTGTTPFNGEHNAGPLAFISRPNAQTQLGPLCTDPDTSVTPARCNP
jgi:hypothetical protein